MDSEAERAKGRIWRLRQGAPLALCRLEIFWRLDDGAPLWQSAEYRSVLAFACAMPDLPGPGGRDWEQEARARLRSALGGLQRHGGYAARSSPLDMFMEGLEPAGLVCARMSLHIGSWMPSPELRAEKVAAAGELARSLALELGSDPIWPWEIGEMAGWGAACDLARLEAALERELLRRGCPRPESETGRREGL